MHVVDMIVTCMFQDQQIQTASFKYITIIWENFTLKHLYNILVMYNNLICIPLRTLHVLKTLRVFKVTRYTSGRGNHAHVDSYYLT